MMENNVMSIQITLNHVKIYFGSEIFIDALLIYLEYIGLYFLLLFKTAQGLINIPLILYVKHGNPIYENQHFKFTNMTC